MEEKDYGQDVRQEVNSIDRVELRVSQILNLPYQTIEAPYIYLEGTVQRNFLCTKESRLTRYKKGDVWLLDFLIFTYAWEDVLQVCLKDFHCSLL